MFNSSYLDALFCKPTQKTPIWLMRQAGRYLPEYMRVRQKAGSFMGLATNPEFAMEVTLQPLERYKLDAAILFSDILTIPDAMGLGLNFIHGEGPKFSYPLNTENAIQKLQVADMQKLAYVFDAVRLIKKELAQKSYGLPLIGFSGSPFTLACYMIEGSGSQNNFESVRNLIYKCPELIKKILHINTLSVIEYLSEQIKAGVDAVMIFDTWGGLLSESGYLEFSLQYIEQIITQLKAKYPHIPCTVFTKGGGVWLEHISKISAQAIGVDWSINIGRARKIVPTNIALQGNLDPLILLSDEKTIQKYATEMLNSYYTTYGNLNGYIANLGHGISQHTPPENVAIFVDTVKKISTQLNSFASN
jgi:uroporphyrinogen decarboxylase